MPRLVLALVLLVALGGCGTSTVSLNIVKPAAINAQQYGGTVSVSQIMAMHPEQEGVAALLANHIIANVRAGYGGVVQVVMPPGGMDISGTLEDHSTVFKSERYNGTCRRRQNYTDSKGKRRTKRVSYKCRRGRLRWQARTMVLIRIQAADGRMLWQRRLSRRRSGSILAGDPNDIRDAVRHLRRLRRDAQRATLRAHDRMRRSIAAQVAAMVVPRQVRVRVRVYDCLASAKPVCVRGAKLMAASQWDASLAAYGQALGIYGQTPTVKPTDVAKVHWNRALVYRFSHRYNLAHAELTKALQLDPGNSSYIAERSRIEKTRADEQRLNAQGLVRQGPVGPQQGPPPGAQPGAQSQPQPQPGPGYQPPQPGPQPAPPGR